MPKKGGGSAPKTEIYGVNAGGLSVGPGVGGAGGSSRRMFGSLTGGPGGILGGVGELLSGLLGGGSGSKTIGAMSSAERRALVGSLAATFPEQAAYLAGLREKVAPGMSALRASRLEGLAGERSRTLGDLRENLGRRRVLGSSFAQDTLTRAGLEFQKEGDRIRAETFLQELELSHAIANEEFTARRGEFETHLNEMNLQLQVATQIATQATAELNANARMKAELDAQRSAGIGSLVGTAVGLFL